MLIAVLSLLARRWAVPNFSKMPNIHEKQAGNAGIPMLLFEKGIIL
jgi:hypothetical protein